MDTTNGVKNHEARATSQLMASRTPAEGAQREYGGGPAARASSAPSTMAFRPSSVRMPSRSTVFAPWDLEDDDDKW